MTGYQKYRGVQVEGASPLELVLLTYDVLIKSLNLAKFAGKEKNYVAEAQHLSRAIEALVELITSLDSENGGTIASSLGSLYAYMNRRLMEASTGGDIAGAIDEVLALANTLREGWQGLADGDSSSQSRQVNGY
ncbi:flagellar protein FliS [Mariprofundus ferrinatatus]|uniref:Flagellar secretion chaperone FliS n=1 Tax=Mariprofundus ferrinatatus TaxID=1921087 RepID=A0A2K8L6L0_9PROT|nr:flagellar export chaperone FliS [Mariprofundus ferrinatatus]ATX82958.1 flagellar protein FliS [Mariprofundus ferrinatatus]